MLRPLVVACVLLPALVFGWLAYQDYRLEAERARAQVLGTTEILAEHAQTVLETADLVLARVLDHINGENWATLSSSPETHDFLLHLKDELPQIESVFLVNPIGLNVASSRLFPFPPIEVSERGYYRAAFHGEASLHISAPFRGIIQGTYAFTASRPRITNGRFDGVVAVTISPAYFEAFYHSIISNPATASAALERADGTMLLHDPALPSGSPGLATDPALLQEIRSGAEQGIHRGVSAAGDERLVAFRRLSGQPVAVIYSVDWNAALATWRLHAIILGCLAVLLSAGLLAIERLAAMRTAREHDALRRLVAETERRRTPKRR